MASPARDPGAAAPLRFEAMIVGGAGHIGLPLGIVLASRGIRTLLQDVNVKTLEEIRGGRMPFMERGAEALLGRILREGQLGIVSDPGALRGVPHVVITIGTPVDEFGNPAYDAVARCVEPLVPYLSDDQTLILRSTVTPGVTQWLASHLAALGKRPRVCFCPERVVQGRAIEEIQAYPQIVSGTTPEAEDAAAAFFGRIAPEVIRLSPMEAEFAKLLSNAYRYIQFAASNQFYMMVTRAGLDYARIVDGMKRGYSRMNDFPGAGFAAGPCLYKDTAQLTAFNGNQLSLGSAAILVNEGLPLFIADRLVRKYDLQTMTVGLLGMAFKADIDDRRAALSYKLKKVFKMKAKAVLTADPHVQDDPELLAAEEVVRRSDLLVLCVPHQAFRGLELGGKPLVDPWNFFQRGTHI